MTLIERAAREAQIIHNGWPANTDSDSWHTWIPAVRAVLTAIREPSGAIIDEAYASYTANGGSLRDVFMDMIDAMLEEG